MIQPPTTIYRPLLKLSIIATLMSGCSSEAETPIPTEPVAASPTPSPSPSQITATPADVAPLDNWQMMTRLQIADEGEGMDLDGSGDVDNNIHGAMVAIQDGIMEAIIEEQNSQTDFPGQVDDCEKTEQGCGLPQPPQDIENIEKLVTTLFSVESLNRSLALPFNAGQHPYALHLSGTSPDNTIEYWSGASMAQGYNLQALLGTQGGSLALDGSPSHMGPGTYDFSVVLETPSGEPVTFAASLYSAQSQFIYGEAALNNAYTGGGISINDMLSLAEDVLEFIDSIYTYAIEDQDPLPVAAILSQLEEALREVADIPCGNGDQCISMSLIYDTVPTSPAPLTRE